MEITNTIMQYYTIFLLITFLVLSYAFLMISNNKKKKKNNIAFPPSPPSLPILGHLHLLRPPRHLSIIDIANRYGGLVFLRLGPHRNALIVSSPAALEEILSLNDKVFANHSVHHAAQVLAEGDNSMFFSPYGELWRSLRRLTLTDLLSVAKVNQQASIRMEELISAVSEMVAIARNNEESVGEVEVRKKMDEMGARAMLRIIAGKIFCDKEEEKEMEREFIQVFGEAIKLLFAFNPRDFFPVLGWADLLGVERKMERLKVRMDAFINRLLDERRRIRVEEGVPMGNKTLLDAMLDMQDTAPKSFTDELIRSHIALMLKAGMESTSEITNATMKLLLCHPEVLKKAREEMDANIGPNQLLQEIDLPKLPYLLCIIKESLRLVPNILGVPPRIPSEDCIIQGYHVPRDTMVFINLWSLHKDAQLWDDPLLFKPERFMGHNGGKDGYKYLPFGAGRRACPGETMGFRAVTYVVGIFIQCFEWIPMTAKEVDLSGLLALTKPKMEPVMIKYRVRDSIIGAII